MSPACAVKVHRCRNTGCWWPFGSSFVACPLLVQCISPPECHPSTFAFGKERWAEVCRVGDNGSLLLLQQEGWSIISAPTVRKAIPNLLSFRRVLMAACSPWQLPDLPVHTHCPQFVNKARVEHMAYVGCWCCSADGCALRAPSSSGMSTVAVIEWIERAVE